MPDFVREVCVGRDDVDLCTGFLEFGVVFCCVLNLGGAIERKRCGHENQNRPLAFEAGFGNFDKLAVMKGLGFEGLYLRINE
jgi:hypothetical protein